MQISHKNRRKLIVAGTLFAVTAVPSFAIFGLGDIVFDPSAYAEMLIQKSQQVEEIAKLEAQLQKAVETAETLQKSYTTAMNTYDQVRSNAAHFGGSKLGWLTSVQRLLKRSDVESRFGEADGFTDAMNKVSSYAADVAWTSSQVRISENNLTSFMNGQPTGGATRSQLAMIEASDAISPSCLSALGAYSQQRSDNSSAGDDLQTQELDGSDDTNSEVQQLNLLNAGQSQQMSEILSQGALHSCIASQMTVANMQMRNAAAADLNTAAFIRQQHATTQNNIEGSSYTWTHYIP